MSIYDINYADRVVELMPPDKRYAKHAAWLKALTNQLQVIHTKIFVQYRTGVSYPAWSPGGYGIGDRVKYGEKIYENLLAGNTSIPSPDTNWGLYLDSFIGVEERLTYNHCKLVLEWALNKRFGTTFRQPIDGNSDIYIGTQTGAVPVFVVGVNEAESSFIYSSTSSEFVINSYSFNTYNFTVNVPLAVFNGVSSVSASREQIFREFVDRYNSAGLKYQIATY